MLLATQLKYLQRSYIFSVHTGDRILQSHVWVDSVVFCQVTRKGVTVHLH